MASAMSSSTRLASARNSASRRVSPANRITNPARFSSTKVKYARMPSSTCWRGPSASRGGLADLVPEAGADVAEQLGEELALGPEVLVEHRLGDPGGVGDGVHRRALVAVVRELLEGDVEQLLAPLGGGQAGHQRRLGGRSSGGDHGYRTVTRPAPPPTLRARRSVSASRRPRPRARRPSPRR